jgi:transposase InsO family protein
MSFDRKTRYSNCVVRNRAKPSRQGSSSLSPLGVPNYPWEIADMDFVTDLLKNSKYNFIVFLVLVCHSTKMAHFVPCHKEKTSEEIIDLFIDKCYKLHGVPKVIVSDRDPRFVGKFWQSFMRKLNTKLNMSTARHPQPDGLTERVNETMQIVLHCYTIDSGFDWVFIYPWLNFTTIALSLKLQKILRLKYFMAFKQLLLLIDCYH